MNWRREYERYPGKWILRFTLSEWLIGVGGGRGILSLHLGPFSAVWLPDWEYGEDE